MNRHMLSFAANIIKHKQHEEDCKLSSHKYCKDKMTIFNLGMAMGFLTGYDARDAELKILIEELQNALKEAQKTHHTNE